MLEGIAWIGFGEAAYHIAKGLRENGFEAMSAYDAGRNDPIRGATIRRRADEVGVTLRDQPAQAVEGARFIVSLTSAKVAVSVAREVIALLQDGQIFLDFNAASPDTKRLVGDVPHHTGVSICDVAVMGPVPLNGHRVPLLIAGEGKEQFFQTLSPYGMQIEMLDAPMGGASAVKMIRSIFMKGFPQVLLECLLAAQHYGVTEKMLESMEGTIGNKTVRQLTDQLFTPTVIHAERRMAEMQEVVQMLASAGLEKQMSEATCRKLSNLASFHIVDEIGSDVKIGYQQLLSMILERQTAERHL